MMFRRVIDRWRKYLINAARHRHALWYLTGVSASEAVFFPIPPDVVLAPMVAAEPRRWGQYVLVTTLSSVAGGIVGYALGAFLFDQMVELLVSRGFAQDLAMVQAWYDRWGVLAVLIAGFSPVPFKLFTIVSGWMALPLGGFVIAALIGRGARFILVGLMTRTGLYWYSKAPLSLWVAVGSFIVGAGVLFTWFR